MNAQKKMGRPRKPAGEKVIKVTCSLPPDVAAAYQQLGGASAARVNLPAIRRGIIAAGKRQP